LENIEEYATLKALGASQSFVARIVLTQALICGVLGSVLGLLAVVPCIGLCKIADSVDLHAVVVTPCHGLAELGHVFTGVDCFRAKRSHS